MTEIPNITAEFTNKGFKKDYDILKTDLSSCKNGEDVKNLIREHISFIISYPQKIIHIIDLGHLSNLKIDVRDMFKLMTLQNLNEELKSAKMGNEKSYIQILILPNEGQGLISNGIVATSKLIQQISVNQYPVWFVNTSEQVIEKLKSENYWD